MTVRQAGKRGGKIGGLSTTPAKVSASRANGAKGGRPIADYTVRKHGDNYGLYFRGSLAESGVFATKATTLKHKAIAENERRSVITPTKRGFVISRPGCVVCGEPPFGSEYCCGHSQA